MAVRIYPQDKGIVSLHYKDGKEVSKVEFDYIHAHDSGEWGSVGISIDCDDSNPYKDSFIQMKLTIEEAEMLIESIKAEIKKARQ